MSDDIDTLSRIPAAAKDLVSLETATDGRTFSIRGVDARDAVLLEVERSLYLYGRARRRDGSMGAGYNTAALRRLIDPDGSRAGMDIDHVASQAIETRRIGNHWILLGLVPREINRHHGSTLERGGAPVREFNAAASARPTSRLNGSMMLKLSGQKAPEPRRRTLYPSAETTARAQQIKQALLQSASDQERLHGLKGERIHPAPIAAPAPASFKSELAQKITNDLAKAPAPPKPPAASPRRTR